MVDSIRSSCIVYCVYDYLLKPDYYALVDFRSSDLLFPVIIKANSVDKH